MQKMSANGRVLIIGLDAATFDLIEPWVQAGLLPNFQHLMRVGAWGRLESTIPPVTSVAWNGFVTGKNPGKHGVFDFVRREPDGYGIRVINGGYRRATPFWRLMDRKGLHVGVVNMPMTYPPDQLEHGFVVSGFDAPGLESDFVYPEGLKQILLRNGYKIHPTKASRHAWAIDLFDLFRAQEDTFWELFDTQPWDVLAMVFMQLDVAQHLFWRDMETADPEFGSVISQLYQEADELLGRVFMRLDGNTTLFVVSDHGAGPLKKAVSINQWLCREGLLAFRKPHTLSVAGSRALRRGMTLLNTYMPSSIKTVLKKRFGRTRDQVESYLLTSQLDWNKTRAFALGEYGGIYLNVQGREANGVVSPGEYDQLRGEVAQRLTTLRDPDSGQPVIQHVYQREDLYYGPYLEEAPDLVLHWDYAYDCRERAGPEGRGVFESEIALKEFADHIKTGVHRQHGVLLAYGPAIEPGRVEGALLIDVIPTVLHLVGLPVPEDMDGRVLTEALRAEWLVQQPVAYDHIDRALNENGDSDYTGDEENQMRERLRALGYLD